MKSATLFCVVGALSDDGAGFAIARCIVLPSVRVVETHTAVRERVISCPHFSSIDHSGGIFYVFVTVFVSYLTTAWMLKRLEQL